MVPQRIDAIGIGELQTLLGQARETKTLEFKRQLPAGKPGALKLLAGVTALANTAGGDFIIGIDEKDGMAAALPGIAVDSADDYAQTLDQVLRAHVEPPLPPFDIQPVPVGADRWAFVVRTPRSWIGPHRVTTDNNFYMRTSTSTVPMDVADLRSAFGLRDIGAERIDAFRRDRLVRIAAGQGSVRLAAGPILVIHLVPLPAFANRDLVGVVDIVAAVARGSQMPMPPSGSGADARVNLHGVYNFPGEDGTGASGYGQLFRSGAYEGTNIASRDGEELYFPSATLADMIVGSTRRYLDLQNHYGFAFPTFLMVSFSGASNLRLRVPTYYGQAQSTPALGEAILSFPEVVLERAADDVPARLRPLLNMIWNAFTVPSCDRYDGQGVWRGI